MLGKISLRALTSSEMARIETGLNVTSESVLDLPLHWVLVWPIMLAASLVLSIFTLIIIVMLAGIYFCMFVFTTGSHF